MRQRQADTTAFKEGFHAYVRARKVEEARGPGAFVFVPIPYKQYTKQATLWIKGWTRAERAEKKSKKASKKETTVGITLGNTKKAKRKKARAPTKKGERTAPVPDKVVVPSSRGRVLRADTPIPSPYHVRARDKRYAPKNKKQERLIRKALKDSDAALGTKRGWYELYRTTRNDGNGFDKRRYGYKLYTFNEWIATEGKQYRV